MYNQLDLEVIFNLSKNENRLFNFHIFSEHFRTHARATLPFEIKDNSDSQNLVDPLEPKLYMSLK
jgi:hypothetical protein